MKLLVVVDVQNDFITGALENKEAIRKLPNVCKYIEEWNGDIVFTRDTHFDNYLETLEGKNLNVPHCLDHSWGWEIASDAIEALNRSRDTKYYVDYIDKNTFGAKQWKDFYLEKYDEIVLIGYCTDICVISNAMLIKAFVPNTPIKVVEECCAGVTPDRHENALKAMQCCHIEVI